MNFMSILLQFCHAERLLFTTTSSQRSHKSGCVLLLPTYARCRQQRAHFRKDVFVTEAVASFACSIVRSLRMKNSSSSSLPIFVVTSEPDFNTTAGCNDLRINCSWRPCSTR